MIALVLKYKNGVDVRWQLDDKAYLLDKANQTLIDVVKSYLESDQYDANIDHKLIVGENTLAVRFGERYLSAEQYIRRFFLMIEQLTILK